MIQKIKNWDKNRKVRLVIGIVSLILGIATKDYIFYFIAAFFLLQAVLNFLPCGINNCTTNNKKEKEEEENTVSDQVKPFNKNKTS